MGHDFALAGREGTYRLMTINSTQLEGGDPETGRVRPGGPGGALRNYSEHLSDVVPGYWLGLLHIA
jgi:hypothetical protein